MKYKKLAVLVFAILSCGLFVIVAKQSSWNKFSEMPVETGAEAEPEETMTPETTAPVYEYEIRELPDPVYPKPAEHFDGGRGIKEDPYLIADAAQLALMSARIRDKEANKTYAGAYYCLVADISLNDVTNFENWREQGPEYSWKPIGDGSEALSFHGDFNGNGHTIRGLYINENNEDDPYAGAYGLFGRVSGTVHDLKVEQSYLAVSGYTANVGTIAGILSDKGVIDNCVSSAVIDCYDAHCGGIAGILEGGYAVGKAYEDGELPGYSVIRNCKFEGTMEQKKDHSFSEMGGIAGTGNGHIVSCSSNGTIGFGSADLNCVGGVIGMLNDGMIAGCEHAGILECRVESASISAEVGGIAGNLYVSGAGSEHYVSRGILVRNCKNTGVVSGKEYAGGIMGRMDCEGDCDHGSNLILQNCVNETDIIAGNAGGIVGHFISESGTAVMQNCDNSGDLTATSQNAAGVIAHWMMDGEPDIRILIEQCDNSGDVVSELNAGGLFGLVDQPAALSAPEKTAVVIQDCKNSGEVKTRKNNGFIGGIAGNIGLKDIPVVLSSCTNSGDLVVENEAVDAQTLSTKKAFTISRIAGGIVGRVGPGLFLTTDTDQAEEENLQKSNAKITFAGCKNTGKLNVTVEEKSVNEEGGPVYKNWFGGIIGNFCGEDGYAVMVDDCSYKHFERGLGNEDYPDIGEKIK